MSHQWDEFSKSLAEESLPRRESLRRLGLVLAGAVLSPLGLGTAFAGHQNPCKAFCKCRNKKQQKACLAACQACGNDPRFLCGSCAAGYACTDLASDPYNCGACGDACQPPGPYEYGACINGRCEYTCVEGAVDCGGYCTILATDVYNCGACGNVCPGPNPSCYQGACSQCIGYCPEGWCGGDGCGGECACPSGTYCESNWCYAENPCPFPFILCGGACVDPTSDPFNCGGCFNQCAPNEVCAGGFCQGFGGDGGW